MANFDRSTLVWTYVVCLLSSTSGCAVCCNPHDCKYPAYGGVIERLDPVHGRVGSLYGPQPVFVPGDRPAPPPATRELQPTPTLPDANTSEQPKEEAPKLPSEDRDPRPSQPFDPDQPDDDLDFPPPPDDALL